MNNKKMIINEEDLDELANDLKKGSVQSVTLNLDNGYKIEISHEVLKRMYAKQNTNTEGTE